ncbi:hypothetical protein LV84_00006 [Algoriphagus ratkowskyi]|uniref:Uncharacterized protein n=1 Tax=Algoriphagus ratkowskyi TaxID=57028 RepID=A0A2W7RJH3_9BACT|nr:hypothetical protein [Algoriphagus ratkowskyi]PZX61018.1 hypothetical protein LV84_00006 [Algoriphagus ratkowskyi]TXD79155.1 hypothetical protein ESW18_02650 [Algoriphagus ratkowskyi]
MARNNILKGGYIQFLTSNSELNVDKIKTYKVLKVESFKRRMGEVIDFVIFKDDFGRGCRVKVDENIVSCVDVKSDRKKKLSVYCDESQILISLQEYSYRRDDRRKEIHKLLKKLWDIGESSKSVEFKNVVDKLNADNYNEEISKKALKDLEDIIDRNAPGFETKNNDYLESDVDDTNYEKTIMNAFKNGEQDRLGY